MKDVKLIGKLNEDGSLVYPYSMTDEEAWAAYADDMAALDRRWSREDGDGPVAEMTAEDRARWEQEHPEQEEHLPFT